MLITGTRVETSDIYAMFRGLETYQRVMRELQDRRSKLPSQKISITFTKRTNRTARS